LKNTRNFKETENVK